VIRVGYGPAWKVRISPYRRAGDSFFPAFQSRQGESRHLSIQGVEDGNMGTVRVRLLGRAGYPWRPGKGRYGAESP